MKCPSCNHTYRLAWREYFKEPRGHHRCPQCHEGFRLRYSFRYVVLSTLGCVIGGAMLALLTFFCFGGSWYVLAAWIAGAGITGIPIDRLLDDRFRKAVAIKPQPT